MSEMKAYRELEREGEEDNSYLRVVSEEEFSFCMATNNTHKSNQELNAHNDVVGY